MTTNLIETQLSNSAAKIAKLEEQLHAAKKERNSLAKEYINQGGSKSKAARLACISRQALYKIIETS